MPFPVFMLSIIYPLLLPRHSLPSFSVHVISLHSFSKSHTPLFTPTCQQNCSIFVRFAQFPSPFCYSQHHSYQHTLRSTLPHNKFPITKLSFISFQYNYVHFHSKTSFSSSLRLNFYSPSTPPSYWFSPTIPYFNFNYFYVINVNNV